MTDGAAEISFSMKGKEDMDSRMIWSFFGAKRFFIEIDNKVD